MRDIINTFCWLVFYLWLAILLSYVTAVMCIVPTYIFPLAVKITVGLLAGCGALQCWLAAYDNARDLIGR